MGISQKHTPLNTSNRIVLIVVVPLCVKKSVLIKSVNGWGYHQIACHTCAGVFDIRLYMYNIYIEIFIHVCISFHFSDGRPSFKHWMFILAPRQMVSTINLLSFSQCLLTVFVVVVLLPRWTVRVTSQCTIPHPYPYSPYSEKTARTPLFTSLCSPYVERIARATDFRCAFRFKVQLLRRAPFSLSIPQCCGLRS